MFAAVLLFALSAAQVPAQSPNPDQLYKSAVDAQLRGDFETAIREYRSLLKVRPQMVEARVNLGAALAHVGQFDAAIPEYRAALPLMDDKAGVLFNIALAYYKKGDWKDARDQFKPLSKAQPGMCESQSSWATPTSGWVRSRRCRSAHAAGGGKL